MSRTCPGLVHLSLFLASTDIPWGHWVTWLLLLWVPCPVASFEVPQSESWAIWLHQKLKLLHQMQIFCAAMSLYHSWMHLGSLTSLHWQLHCIGTDFMLILICFDLMLFALIICMSILCPVIWCPYPEMITLMQCPGHVQQAVHLELFWTCSWRTFPTKNNCMHKTKKSASHHYTTTRRFDGSW